MYVGHYAVSLALKALEKRVSLGVLFIAVQLVDIVFFPLVLLGVERINIIENFTESTHFELEYMPYTHSLLAAVLWSAAAYAVFRWVVVRQNSVAIVVAVAVFSHWVLDLIVHTPDLPLWSDMSLKLGFGLWNDAMATYALEAALLLAGLWIYLRSLYEPSGKGRYGMILFVSFLLLINVANIFGPLAVDSKPALAITVTSSYLLFAFVAYRLDSKTRR